MGVINVLDKHVAELIAAGEVVERPASVIKELVENSIDAGAKNITVEIKNGGTTFMRVTDDGCGIQKDDIKVAFLRHATSKVKIESDLDCISTLGFRGEALASICAVSRLQLITRNINEDIGTCYEIEGGEETSFGDAGCPVGTTFVIKDLFYNIPARAKFLKKDVSEGNAVSNIIDKTALSHPDIAFTYIRDGKQVLKTFGDGKLLSAVYSVFGKDFAHGLMSVDYQLDAIKVYGFVSKPQHSRPNRNMQNFFINGRYVKTRTAMAALEEAFKGSVMVGKYPSCVLNIEVPYEMIDVNVHPAKIEVRFINERPVFDAVYHAVKSSLLKNDSRKNVHFKTDTAFNEIKDSRKFNPFRNAPAILGNSKTNTSDELKQPEHIAPNKKEVNPFDEIDYITSPKREIKTVAKNGDSNDLTIEINQHKKVNIDNLKIADSKKPFDIYSKEAIKNSIIENKYNNKQVLETKDVFDQLPGAEDNISASTKSGTEKKNENHTVVQDSSTVVSSLNDENTNSKCNNYSQPIIAQDEDEIKYIGEAFSTYIIAEKNGKEILFIDKHAAHERMIYEKLKAEKAGAFSQLLLQPVTVTLGKEEYDAAINNLQMFSECSFEVDDFGNSTVIVRSAPQYIDATEISDCITEMADYISKGKNDIFSEKMDWFYHNVACRSAVKAGNKSTPQELIELVKKLEKNPQIRYCPHGRPISIVMKKSEIERQFGRV